MKSLNEKIDNTTHKSTIESIISYLENKINKQDYQSVLTNTYEQLKKYSEDSASNLKNQIKMQLNELSDENTTLVTLNNVIKQEEELKNKQEKEELKIKQEKEELKIKQQEEKRKTMGGYMSNRVITNKHPGSYWCSKSDYILKGAFEAKISILKIDENEANKDYWCYIVGLIKVKESYVDDKFLNNSICLANNGYIKKFFGNHTFKLFNYNWKCNDIIIVKRDSLKNIYFGINNQTKVAYENISGHFRLVIGFSSSVRDGDILELTELNEY